MKFCLLFIYSTIISVQNTKPWKSTRKVFLGTSDTSFFRQVCQNQGTYSKIVRALIPYEFVFRVSKKCCCESVFFISYWSLVKTKVQMLKAIRDIIFHICFVDILVFSLTGMTLSTLFFDILKWYNGHLRQD